MICPHCIGRHASRQMYGHTPVNTGSFFVQFDGKSSPKRAKMPPPQITLTEKKTPKSRCAATAFRGFVHYFLPFRIRTVNDGSTGFLRHYVLSQCPLLAKSSIAKQKTSHAVNVVCDGSPSRILRVLLISLGITILPKSSTRRTMPVAFIYLSPFLRRTSKASLVRGGLSRALQ